MATLVTPSKLRDLQRALYRRAKSEPRFRFYALYDKVYRPDVLAHAFAVAKGNDGAPGPDGKTFEQIEEDGEAALLEQLHDELKTKTYRPGPVRRVYIPKTGGGERPLGIPNIRDRVVQTAAKLVLEPIFEADFDPDSYGFRPKRSAHDALAVVRESLEQGMCWVLDADIASYFDTIPHDRLMKAVAERVVDGSMLALVKMFLMAPIVDERDGGSPRRPGKGTPQGGVISPLLANIYLHLLDRNFRRHVERGELEGRLVRYADDFVLLSSRNPVRERAWVESVLERLGLTLHPDKTRIVHAGKDHFDFLGYRFRRRWKYVSLDIAKKSLARIRDAIRARTCDTGASLAEVVEGLSVYIRGARAYFGRARQRRLFSLDHFVDQRVARWWARKHQSPGPAWSLVRQDGLRRHHGLERWYVLRENRSTRSRPDG